MNNAHMPAMPLTDEQIDRSKRFEGYEGFTKREEIAARNMAAILANSNYDAPRRLRFELMAQDAVTAADALLAELDNLENGS